MLSSQVKTLPNHLLLEGHTDAQPYPATAATSNWELSADRANSWPAVSSSRAASALPRIAQVRGYADQQLRLPDKPLDPSNRRISLIVQWLDAASPPTGRRLRVKRVPETPPRRNHPQLPRLQTTATPTKPVPA